MNEKERFRLGTICDVCEKRIKRKNAAQLLNVSVRQVQRLITRYRDIGAAGLVHQRRGQSPGNKINADIRSQCLNLILKYYSDFGPTLAREKLIERHGIKIGLETLRQ
ncbi:helix-turn-helix domain-containing protein [Photobacterium phosphoreum]|uniref:helix-turn-helix domain-containing protein n=1 Tax=Photobacterium phosphoreum TaxID=659 RepID=UPI001F30CD0A|nr:helix-turn-helix domain-containing protein [Photobacterium phosphoreum]